MMHQEHNQTIPEGTEFTGLSQPYQGRRISVVSLIVWQSRLNELLEAGATESSMDMGHFRSYRCRFVEPSEHEILLSEVELDRYWEQGAQ